MKKYVVLLILMLFLFSCVTSRADKTADFDKVRKDSDAAFDELENPVEINSDDEIPVWVINRDNNYKSGGFEEIGIGQSSIDGEDAFNKAAEALASLLGVKIQIVISDYYSETNGDVEESYSSNIILDYIHELKGYKTEKLYIKQGDYSGHWVKLSLPLEAIYKNNLTVIRVNNSTDTQTRDLEIIDHITDLLKKTTFSNPNGLHKIIKRVNPDGIVLPYQGDNGNLNEIFEILETLSNNRLTYNEIYDFNSVIRELKVESDLTNSEIRKISEFSRSIDSNLYKFDNLDDRNIKNWCLNGDLSDYDNLLTIPYSIYILKKAVNDGLINIEFSNQDKTLFTDIFSKLLGVKPISSTNSDLNILFNIEEIDDYSYSLSYRFNSGENNAKNFTLERDTRLLYSNQLRVIFRELIVEIAQQLMSENVRFATIDKNQKTDFLKLFEISSDRYLSYKIFSEDKPIFDDITEWFYKNDITRNIDDYNFEEVRLNNFIQSNLENFSLLNIYDYQDSFSSIEKPGRDNKFYFKSLLNTTISLNSDSLVNTADYLFLNYKYISNIRGTDSELLKNTLKNSITNISVDYKYYWELMEIYWDYIKNDVDIDRYNVDRLLSLLSDSEFSDNTDGYEYLINKRDNRSDVKTLVLEWDKVIEQNATNYPLWLSEIYGLYGYYGYQDNNWEVTFSSFIKSYITSYGNDTKILNLIANNRDEWRRFLRNSNDSSYIKIFISLFNEIYYNELNSIKDVNRYQNVKSDIRL